MGISLYFSVIAGIHKCGQVTLIEKNVPMFVIIQFVKVLSKTLTIGHIKAK